MKVQDTDNICHNKYRAIQKGVSHRNTGNSLVFDN